MASACGGHAVRIENETDTVPLKLGSSGVERLPREMNIMKIKDDKEMEEKATVVAGNVTEAGHIIATTIGGRNGEPKQTISYMAERVVGTGSFGIVFQAKCLETGETVAIKKVLQDRRYKNRELQTMRILDHPNVVSLKHCFFFLLLIRMNCTLTWYWSMSQRLFIG